MGIVPACMSVPHMCLLCLYMLKEAVISHGTGITEGFSAARWVLVTEVVSSARAASTPSQRAIISPAQCQDFCSLGFLLLLLYV